MRKLAFCRTPLQSLIIQRLIDADPEAQYTVVYVPTSRTPKHAFYFGRIRAADKAFVPYFNAVSHTFAELLSFSRIPGRIRAAQYDRYLVASFPSLAFALLERARGEIATFDDGLINLDRALFRSFVHGPGRIDNAIRRVAGARLTQEIIASSALHYTIFSPADIQMPISQAERIDLLSRSELNRQRTESVTVLLGTRVDLSPHPKFAVTSEHFKAWGRSFDRLKASLGHDIYLPHPSAAEEPQLNAPLAGRDELRRMLDTHIAEDVVLELVKRGSAVRVYGVASTALLVLRDYASCINVVIPDYNSASVARFSALGVPSVSVDEAILAPPAQRGREVPRCVRRAAPP